MRSQTLLGLGVAALLLIGLFQLIRSEGQLRKAQSPVTSAPARPKLLKVPSDLEWSQLSEDELREFISHFADEAPEREQRVMGDFDSLVSERETVVTRGHEIAPGKFAFSSLTPRIAPDHDGSRIVKVDIKVFTIEEGGEYTMRYSNELDVRTKFSFPTERICILSG